MTVRSLLDQLPAPLVLCVGVSSEHLPALAEATGGRAVLLFAPTADRVGELLTGMLPGAVAGVVAPAVAAGDGEALPAHRVAECGELRLDADVREATWGGQLIPLPSREFDVLFALTRDPGRVWTFADLTTQVWKRPYLGDAEAVVSAVKRLRRQVRAVTPEVQIASIRGLGFRLVVSAGP